VNRLQICQRIRLEAALAGSGPSSTLNQTGELGEVVKWSDTAYEDIQNLHTDWEFLRNDFSFDTISGTADYTKAAIQLTAVKTWKLDSCRVYLDSTTDEQWLCHIPWNIYRDTRLLGSNRNVTGRPIEFSVKPNKSLSIWPVPDDVYTITGECYYTARTMTADLNEPIFPADFHVAIVWRALMFYARFMEDPNLLGYAEREYKQVLFALENDQLPTMGEAPALA
jgi:hypothetical protein